MRNWRYILAALFLILAVCSAFGHSDWRNWRAKTIKHLQDTQIIEDNTNWWSWILCTFQRATTWEHFEPGGILAATWEEIGGEGCTSAGLTWGDLE